MLTDAIIKMMEKEKLGDTIEVVPNYSSGFDIIDYRNGRVEDGEKVLGFDGGKIITFIGKSGTGKSTLAIQIAKSIVEPFEEGQIIHLDYERATNKARIQNLTGWDNKTIKKKYLLVNNDIYSETLYQIVKGIDKTKNNPETYEKIKIDSGKTDEDDNPIYILPPTVVLVDSWAIMTPKDIAEESELSGSMAASSIAKTNNAVIKRLTGPLFRGNIILIIVNHITQKIDISAFSKTQASLNYLKQD